MNTKHTITAIVGLALAGAAAHAGTITHSGMIASATTNWTTSFQAPQFDDLGGTRILESVSVEVLGTLNTTARVENRSATAQVITLNMGANITLKHGAETLAMSSPAMTQAFSSTAFDGAIDFSGTSGATFAGLTDSVMATALRGAPIDDLSAWIGNGFVTLTGQAQAFSSVLGSGNITTLFQSTASMGYTITYSYRGNALVPLPTGAGLGVAGMFAAAGVRRRRAV